MATLRTNVRGRGVAPRIFALVDSGRSAAEVAAELEITPEAIKDFLARCRNPDGGWRARALAPSKVRAREARRPAIAARRRAAEERRAAELAERLAQREARKAERLAQLAEIQGPKPYDAEFKPAPRVERPRPAPPDPSPWVGSASVHAGRETRRTRAGMTRAQVLEVAELRRSGLSVYAIAGRMGCDRRTIEGIVNGRTWRGLGRVEVRKVGVKLDDAQVAELRRRYAAGGVTFAELAQVAGVTASHVRRIIRGRTDRPGGRNSR